MSEEKRRLPLAARLAIFLVLQVVAELGLGIALAVVFLIVMMATGRSPEGLRSGGAATWASIIGFWPRAFLSVGVVWLCRSLLDGRPMRSLGLVRPRASAVGGLVLGLALTSLSAGVLLALGGLRWTGLSGSLQTVVLVPTLAVAAFHEELVFRGYLLQNFMDAGRSALGIVLSSVLFWLVHTFNTAVWSSPLASVNLFLAGVLLALAYRLSGDIWFPTALHWGWNMGQGVLFELPISGIRTDGLIDVELTGQWPLWLTGGGFGLESSAVAIAIQVLMVALFAAMLVQRQRAAQRDEKLTGASGRSASITLL